MYLTSLTVKGYRSLVDAIVPLQPLTVIIGPNGCGKSSVAEVLTLLGIQAAKYGQTIDQKLIGLGGINAVRSFIAATPEQIVISVTTDSDLAYQILLTSNYAAKLSIEETFIVKSNHAIFHTLRQREDVLTSWHGEAFAEQIIFKHQKDLINLEKLIYVLEHPTSDFNNQETKLANLLSNSLFIDKLNTTPNSLIRLPQTLLPELRPGKQGETLFSCLSNLRNTQQWHSKFVEIEEVMKQAFPGFDRIELPVVGAGQITLTWHDHHLSQPLYPGQLSDGTLQFLWLTTTLLSADPPPLIVIDEPEVNLHPALLQLLAGLLQNAATHSQIIILTHSSDLIHWLSPEQIVIADKENGATRFISAANPSFNLNEWLQDFSLSDLWRMGVLGGQP